MAEIQGPEGTKEGFK